MPNHINIFYIAGITYLGIKYTMSIFFYHYHILQVTSKYPPLFLNSCVSLILLQTLG